MTERTHIDVGAYYDQPTAEIAEATGAGLIWFMGRDHLSPALSNRDEYALDSQNWREASSQRVLSLIDRMNILQGEVIVDLGCGIGGPGRDVAEYIDCRVLGLSVSHAQLKNLRTLSDGIGSRFTDAIAGDMQRLPLASSSVDHAYSINAIYHVNDKDAVIAEAHRVLKPGGTFGVDDWFITRNTQPTTHTALRYNWSTSSNGFHEIGSFKASMASAGFENIQVEDFTEEAGAFLSEKRFGRTFDEQIATTLLSVFPKLYQYEGYQPKHASMAVEQLRSNILYMGELYRNGEAVYQQIIGSKAYA